MRLIELDSSEIMLTGITLNSTFSIRNPHQILAVMFEFQSRPQYFQIEPMRGMVLRGEKKLVRIRLKPEYRGQAEQIEARDNVASLRATYYCEYNKKLLEAKAMRGWTTISTQLQQTNIPIKLSFQAEIERLRESYRNGSSLKNSRKQNSFEKFRDSSVKRVKNSKLNEDLDFLFRNEEYARLKSKQVPQVKASTQSFLKKQREASKVAQLSSGLNVPSSRPSQQNGRLGQHNGRLGQHNGRIDQHNGRLGQHNGRPSKQSLLNLQRVNVQSNDISAIKSKSALQHYVESPKKQKDNRGFQLVVLAIVAALFLAIGEGLGGVLKQH